MAERNYARGICLVWFSWLRVRYPISRLKHMRALIYMSRICVRFSIGFFFFLFLFHPRPLAFVLKFFGKELEVLLDIRWLLWFSGQI